MKITAINVRGWLGVSELSLPVASKYLAITGPNGAGKTSLIEGLRFALLGEVPRGITRKTDRHLLVHEGFGKTGYVEVEVDGERRYRRDIATYELAGSLLPEREAGLLPYVLDAATFGRLDLAKRRAFLFGLAGLKVNAEAVGAELVNEGVPAEVVEQVLPNLRSGFGAAADYAKERASEARGEWKGITGENYGTNKAEGWQAAVEGLEHVMDADALAALHRQYEDENRVHADAVAKHAVARSELAKGQRAAATPKHRDCEVIAKELSDAQAELKAIDAELVALRARLGNAGGLTAPCPHCAELVTVDRGKLIKATGHGEAHPAIEDALRGEEAARRGAEAKVEALQRELAVAQAASELADVIGPAVNAEDVERARLVAEAAHAALVETRRRIDAAELAANAEQAAAYRTEQAAAAHQRVLGWLKAGELLAPEGIPARYVAKAVKPINDVARHAALATGWPQVHVGADMAVTIGGTRPYELASESEQWRADAVLAAAIAKHSGLRLLVLDRFDVLEPDSRFALWDWLLGMSEDFDTVIAAGTLKGPPSFPAEDDVQVVWLGLPKE